MALDEYSTTPSTNTEDLVAGAHTIIATFRPQLDAAGAQRYDLGALLHTMLDCAPTIEGGRCVAAELHAAYTNDDNGRSVVGVATAWLDHFFLPFLYSNLALARQNNVEPPLCDYSEVCGYFPVHVNKEDEPDFQLGVAVAEREHYRCVINGRFDRDRVDALSKAHRSDEIPRGFPGLGKVTAVRILPFTYIDEAVGLEGVTLLDVQLTWDMLRAWTQIEPKGLNARAESASNRIYMSWDQYDDFAAFDCFLDKDVFPDDANKYKAKTLRRWVLSNGYPASNVIFDTTMGVDPPSAEFIAIHAAFAQVLHKSGVAKYFELLQSETKRINLSHLKGEVDLGQALESHLALLPGAGPAV
ncbi:hypothetical protein DFH06DRAFT_319666 [Mycena polygramma]|nr:hypothetical protein DFH06DRAFT_319666 [Mycena polygramma]